MLVFASACADGPSEPAAPGSELGLSDFSFLQLGMAYDAIAARVGEPARDVGSGLHIFVYPLADGDELLLSFASPDELMDVDIYHPSDGSSEPIFAP